jgi:TRAP-type C4-dicarboxylate transport system permease small subunit
MTKPMRVDDTSAHAVQRALTLLLVITEYVGAAVLTVDVLVVFASVIWRYFLHDPVDWAEKWHAP